MKQNAANTERRPLNVRHEAWSTIPEDYLNKIGKNAWIREFRLS